MLKGLIHAVDVHRNRIMILVVAVFGFSLSAALLFSFAATEAYAATTPGKASIKSISKGITSIEIKAKKVSKAKGYQYRIASNKSFTKFKKTKTSSSRSCKFKGLHSSKRYYVKVRAYVKANGKKVYGKWSLVKKVKTKAAKPGTKESALSSNPKKVYGTNINENAPASKIAGVVHYRYISNGDLEFEKGYVCYLQLRSKIELSGTQYMYITSSRVILPKSFSKYKGKTIKISSHYSGRVTATIPEAAISPIWAYDAKLVKAWK